MPKISDRYTVIELAFFLSYFFLFNVLTDIEFNLREPGGSLVSFLNTIPYRMATGASSMIAVFIYYRVLVQERLQKAKYLQFFALLIVYLFVYNIYASLVSGLMEGWLLGQTRGRSTDAISLGAAFHLNFSVLYTLRELLFVTAFSYFIRYLRQQDEILREKNLRLSNELNSLKFQLQPHFFFNTLNSIYSLVLHRSEKAPALIASHAEIMRHIIYKTSEPTVSLKSEIEFLQNYTEVERSRFDGTIEFKFESNGITDEARIEPLLLLPVFENIFKHGFSDQPGSGTVTILICLLEDELVIETSNPKSQTENASTAGGLGLANLQQQLQLLYPGKHSFQAEDCGDNYEVRISLILG